MCRYVVWKSAYSFLKAYLCLNQQALGRLKGCISKDFKVSCVVNDLAELIFYVTRFFFLEIENLKSCYASSSLTDNWMRNQDFLTQITFCTAHLQCLQKREYTLHHNMPKSLNREQGPFMTGLYSAQGHRNSPFAVTLELWVFIPKVHQFMLPLVSHSLPCYSKRYSHFKAQFILLSLHEVYFCFLF